MYLHKCMACQWRSLHARTHARTTGPSTRRPPFLLLLLLLLLLAYIPPSFRFDASSLLLPPLVIAVLDGPQVLDAKELGVAPAVEPLEVAEDVVLAIVDVDDHAGCQTCRRDERPESNAEIHPGEHKQQGNLPS